MRPAPFLDMSKVFVTISTDGEDPIYFPVVKIGYNGERDYLLKQPDRRKVQAVFEYLNDKGLEVFLGGEVLQSRFQDNRFLPEPYQHIDIIGVGHEQQASEVFRELTESPPEKMPFNYSSMRFKVIQKSERSCFDPHNIEEFWINLMTHNSTSHAINLSILTDNLFREYQKK